LPDLGKHVDVYESLRAIAWNPHLTQDAFEKAIDGINSISHDIAVRIFDGNGSI
jgi:hypothetical protein